MVPTVKRITSCVLGALCALSAHSHSVGEHGLTGANPAGDPRLPVIRGPFTAELKVKFESQTPASGKYAYQTIFEYNDDGKTSIWFGQHYKSDELALYLTQGDESTYCFKRGPHAIEVGVFMKLSFGVDLNNSIWIKKNGELIVQCATSVQLPVEAHWTHKLLGKGSLWAVDPLVGSISGVQITNLNEPRNFATQLEFLNLPGQVFGKGFVASFYARFDDLNRRYQRVFDFGNGQAMENVWCGQVGRGSTMACELYQENTRHRIEAPGSIVEGEFAFWHFGVDSEGTARIEKDGKVLVTGSSKVLPTDVFRRQLKVAESHWPADEDLDGVVLGLRVDSLRIS